MTLLKPQGRLINGKRVYQIIATDNDSPYVTKGDVGGWVQNLDQLGIGSWIKPNVVLLGHAKIADGVIIDAVEPDTIVEDFTLTESKILDQAMSPRFNTEVKTPDEESREKYQQQKKQAFLDEMVRQNITMANNSNQYNKQEPDKVIDEPQNVEKPVQKPKRNKHKITSQIPEKPIKGLIGLTKQSWLQSRLLQTFIPKPIIYLFINYLEIMGALGLLTSLIRYLLLSMQGGI